MIIWLQGPSGAGKSTVGRELAALRGVPFVDLDAEIERQQGRSVADIFWSDGESAFRAMEWNALLALMERDSEPRVIALGGGAVIDSAVRAMMRATGLRVFLNVDADTAMERLAGGEPRPLLYDEDPPARWRALYRSRLRFYEETDSIVECSARTPAELAQALNAELERLAAPAWEYAATVGGQATHVAGYGALHSLAAELHRLTAGRQTCVVIDRVVERYYGDYLFGHGEREGLLTLAVDAGEEHKTLSTVGELASGLAGAGFTRDCVIVGIGGGVVTDMAGLLASIYMRGVRSVYVPTTLLAMVDAAVGGKTAVNTAGVRNLIGTYWQPEHVLVAPAFLRSLAPRELRSGFVESVKMGIANSAELARVVADAMLAVAAGEIPANIGEVIRLSVRAKLDVVERDAHDAALRLSLNFGHTFAHALEGVEPGVYAHGEAVAVGMLAASAMARELGTITAARQGAIAASAIRFAHGGSGTHDYPALLRAMALDKKRAGAAFRFVLPAEQVGFTMFATEDAALVRRSLETAFGIIADTASPYLP